MPEHRGHGWSVLGPRADDCVDVPVESSDRALGPVEAVRRFLERDARAPEQHVGKQRRGHPCHRETVVEAEVG